jgi:hypothetical protein
VPGELDVHSVMDNLATQQTKGIRDGSARHPRWHGHSTPTSASWRDQVERFFALLTAKPRRRGMPSSTPQLDADILAYIDTVKPIRNRSAGPKPPTTFPPPSSASASAISASQTHTNRSCKLQNRDTRSCAANRSPAPRPASGGWINRSAPGRISIDASSAPMMSPSPCKGSPGVPRISTRRASTMR